ncbi:MAG: M42 family metallopeptidase [bacterium]
MKELIRSLVEATGPSGYETQVRELVQTSITGLADEVKVDALGNLIARKGKLKEGGKRVMLSAHMDEIGLIATFVDDNGFIRFTANGGVFPVYLLGSRVRFLNGVEGVIGAESNNLRDQAPAMDKCFIDVGAKDRLGCPVSVGDMAVFVRPYLDLGDRLVSKALDDRVGVAILVEALKQLQDTPNELYFVFSTQEEVGTRGAITAAYAVDPELGIALDVTKTGDTPKCDKMEVTLGKGPTVKVRDSGMLSDPRVVRWMRKTAEKAGISYQLEVLEAGSTDARSIQVTRSGVPVGVISIPCRYVHSPSEMVDYQDVVNSVKLLVALLSERIVLEQQ